MEPRYRASCQCVNMLGRFGLTTGKKLNNNGKVVEAPEPVVMTMSDVIRHNLRRLREELDEKYGEWSQARVASIITSRSGEKWTQSRLSDLEGRREGRKKTISPEELVTLALTYDVSVVELMTPPQTVNDRPVRVRVGQDAVSPEVFTRLAFLLDPAWQASSFWDRAHHGRDREGQIAAPSSTAWYAAKLVEAVQAVYPDLPASEWENLIQDEERVVEVFAWLGEHYGIEVMSKFSSQRMRDAVMDTPPRQGDNG